MVRDLIVWSGALGMTDEGGRVLRLAGEAARVEAETTGRTWRRSSVAVAGSRPRS
jgi:hypothetical protein